MGASADIRVGFIGLGRICSLLEDDPLREKPASHAGAFAAREDAGFLGGYDTDPQRARAFAARWNTEAMPTPAALVERRPDILVVATHPDSHLEYLRLAVRHRVPVVVMEKPVAAGRRQARAMQRLEQRGPTRIVVNHERRFSRDYALARSALAERRFGALCGVHARLFFGRTQRRDRVLLHDGTHLLDAIAFLAGGSLRLHRRVGRLRSSRGSTMLHGSVGVDRVPVGIEIGSGRNFLHFEITLSCEHGEILIGNGLFSWRESRVSPYYSAYRSLAELHRNVPVPTGYFTGVAAEALRLVRDPDAKSRSSIADGRATVREIRRAAWRF